MQVGAFYEVYGLLNADGTYSESEIANVSRICDLAIANKTGSDISGKPVKMADFNYIYLINIQKNCLMRDILFLLSIKTNKPQILREVCGKFSLPEQIFPANKITSPIIFLVYGLQK